MEDDFETHNFIYASHFYEEKINNLCRLYDLFCSSDLVCVPHNDRVVQLIIQCICCIYYFDVC